MPNWVKLSDEKKRTFIADSIREIESKFPITDDEQFEILIKCFHSIKEGSFDERHFAALQQIHNGKNYWNVIRSIALKGSIDERMLEKFEKETII